MAFSYEFCAVQCLAATTTRYSESPAKILKV